MRGGASGFLESKVRGVPPLDHGAEMDPGIQRNSRYTVRRTARYIDTWTLEPDTRPPGSQSVPNGFCLVPDSSRPCSRQLRSPSQTISCGISRVRGHSPRGGQGLHGDAPPGESAAKCLRLRQRRGDVKVEPSTHAQPVTGLRAGLHSAAGL